MNLNTEDLINMLKIIDKALERGGVFRGKECIAIGYLYEKLEQNAQAQAEAEQQAHLERQQAANAAQKASDDAAGIVRVNQPFADRA